VESKRDYVPLPKFLPPFLLSNEEIKNGSRRGGFAPSSNIFPLPPDSIGGRGIKGDGINDYLLL